jgi:hypothetical protein
MRATRKKRANLARRQRGSRKVFLMTLSLALGALAIGGTCELGAQSEAEAGLLQGSQQVYPHFSSALNRSSPANWLPFRAEAAQRHLIYYQDNVGYAKT